MRQDQATSVSIRKAALDDSESVLALLDQYDRESDPRPADADVAKVFAELERSPGGIFLAEFEGKLVGTFQLVISPQINHSARPFALVENVIVERAARRRGIGKQMIREAIRIAEEAGSSKLYLTSGAHRPENHRFYESCGLSGTKIGFQIKF